MKRLLRSFLAVAMLLCTGAVPIFAGPPRYHERGGSDGRDDGQFQFRFRAGVFTPDGNSDFWDDTQRTFSGNASDMDDVIIAGDFAIPLNRNVDLFLSASAYEGSQSQRYRDFTDENGGAIKHRSRLDIVPVTIAFVAYPAGHHAAVSPYLGLGGGFYGWRYRESGDFIDFSSEFNDIIRARYESRGIKLGWFGVAGLEIPVGTDWSLLVEGRWDRVKADLKDDFDGFGTIDLGGRQVTAGATWRF